MGTYAFIAISEDDYLWGKCDKVQHMAKKDEMCSLTLQDRSVQNQIPFFFLLFVSLCLSPVMAVRGKSSNW